MALDWSKSEEWATVEEMIKTQGRTRFDKTFYLLYACCSVFLYIILYTVVYMYVSMYLCMYLCMYAYTYVHIHVHMYIYIYVYVYIKPRTLKSLFHKGAAPRNVGDEIKILICEVL